MRVPFDKDMVAEVLHGMRITNVGDATIRQTVAIAEELERRTGEKFIHLEMGSPGLRPTVSALMPKKLLWTRAWLLPTPTSQASLR